MAKAKRKTAPVAAQPAPVAAQPVATAKLTRRNATPSNALLVLGKPSKARAAHNTAAWQAISAALASGPQSAATLAALPVFADKQYAAALVSGPAHVSYLQRRGNLVVQGAAQPGK